MIIFLVYTGIGISIIMYKNRAAADFDEKCELQTGWPWSYQTIYDEGDQVLCSSSCACDADPTLFSEELQETMVTDAFGESMLLDCPYSTMTTA